MSVIVNILESFLGTPHSHYENKSQVQFDCPRCSEEKGKYNGDGKGNLAVNYSKGVYKCWACWERNNMYGTISALIKKYGNKQNYKDYLLVAPDIVYTHKDNTEAKAKIISLPESYKLFTESSPYFTNYNDANKYVTKRGITDKMKEKFKIGYTIEGTKKNRIIIPSFDLNGDLNYYIARAFYSWMKPKYKNPEAEKELIIFNEGLINWDSTIYLVEGAFDHIVTPNSIPLLGKNLHDLLFYTLQEKAKGNVVIILDGGEQERKDALILYKKLNVMNLYDRIKIVYLKDDWDLSLINEKYGSKGIYNVLKSAHKLKESRL